MPKRKILEAEAPSDRAKMRRELGTLRDLAVQPATKKRYDKAVAQFSDFLKKEQLSLPTCKDKLDPLVCEYIEHLWSSGVGRAQANDTVAALQNLQANLRGQLPGAWRLLKTWAVNEVPNRAPPLPEQVLLAMTGWAFFKGHVTFGISLLLGFYTMLRSGEILGLKSSHIMVSTKERQVLVSLGYTKGGKRQGAAESVILGVQPAFKLVQQWKQNASLNTPLAHSPASWRGLFTECLEALELSHFNFRPYSLRRGGATYWFQKHGNLDRILVQGRWLAHKTARVYLNEGLALLAQTRINFNSLSIRSFLNIYEHTVKKPDFSTLEPPGKPGRSGRRGKRSNWQGKRRVQNAHLEFFRLTTISV